MDAGTLMQGASTLPLGILDGVGIAVGLITVYLLVGINRRMGGKINSALRLFIAGALVNTIAIVWSSFVGHIATIGGVQFDIHHVLMTVGMVFFSFSAHRFSSLIAG